MPQSSSASDARRPVAAPASRWAASREGNVFVFPGSANSTGREAAERPLLPAQPSKESVAALVGALQGHAGIYEGGLTDEQCAYERIRQAVEELPNAKIAAKILKACYGLDGQEGLDLYEVAEQLGRTSRDVQGQYALAVTQLVSKLRQ